MVPPRGNPEILKHGGGTEMWMWLCIEGFIQDVEVQSERGRQKEILLGKERYEENCSSDNESAAQEAVEEADSCCDGHQF